MSRNKHIALFIGIFLLQFFVAELLSIRGIRPDFIFIYVLYMAIQYGSFWGVVLGFCSGLAADLTGIGSYFALSALLYTLTGYLAGFLKNRFHRMRPYYFILLWVLIVGLYFFLYAYVRYHYIFNHDLMEFWMKWLGTTGYTLGFLIVIQYLKPLR